MIVDDNKRLTGIVTRGDLLRALEADPSGKMPVLEAGTRALTVTYPDEVLHTAVSKMLRNNIGRLPVVDRNDEKRIVGYIGRPGIMAARLRRWNEEHVREIGWIRRQHVK